MCVSHIVAHYIDKVHGKYISFKVNVTLSVIYLRTITFLLEILKGIAIS